MSALPLASADVWLIAIIALAVLFDLTNGANETAGMVASAVTTRSLSARGAFVLAAITILLVQVIPLSGVAHVIGNELVGFRPDAAPADPARLFAAGLIGGIAWNLASRYAGLPSSATHALVGGLIGAAIAVGGRIEWGLAEFLGEGRLVGVGKAVAGLVLSPLVGLLAAYGLTAGLSWAFSGSGRNVEGWLRLAEAPLTMGQVAFYGLNGAQRTMGIIGAALAWHHGSHFAVPLWVRFLVATSLGVGANISSRRIVRRVGSQIVRVTPLMAVTSQATSLASAAAATFLGLPISSTQVVSSSIAGTGMYWRMRAVRYRTVRAIFLTWFVTLPGSIAAGWAAGVMLRRF